MALLIWQEMLKSGAGMKQRVERDLFWAVHTQNQFIYLWRAISVLHLIAKRHLAFAASTTLLPLILRSFKDSICRCVIIPKKSLYLMPSLPYSRHSIPMIKNL